MAARTHHGWWPYLLPLFSFLGIGELAGRLPEAWQAGALPLKVAVPGALFLLFLRRGAYPELRGAPRGAGGLALDFGVGLVGAALWMAPFVLALRSEPPLWMGWPELLRPDPADAFDPGRWGPGLAWLMLLLRGVGFAVVTPFVEELFVRSWLCRYAEVYDRRADFRDVPIGHYSLRSLVIVTLFFTASHVTWEWPVAVPWILGTQLWFYRRRSLPALVAVHAGSNFGIFAAVLAGSGRLPGAGGPMDLWFFL